MNEPQVKELMLRRWEPDAGGLLAVETAVECAVNSDLREVWSKYLEQTRTQVTTLRKVCDSFGFDPDERTPGREEAHGASRAAHASARPR